MTYSWLLIVIIHTAGLLFAWQALFQPRTPQGTLAWILALIFIPYVAVPAFLYFGEQKFSGYVRARRSGDSHLSPYAEKLADSIQSCHVVLSDNHPYKPLENLTRLNFSSHNRCELLIDGKNTFHHLCQQIDTASHYILMQFYIVEDDALAQRARGHLLNARQRGVCIYFLYDEIGCHDLSADFWQPLRDHDAQIHAFNSSRGRHKFQLNFRNHRKICVIDGEQAYIGGHNLSAHYLGNDIPWRDTHLHLQGPAVLSLQLFFLEDWYWATGQTPELNWQVKIDADNSNCRILPIALAPTNNFSTGVLLFTELINSAKSRIWLVSPYFVPDESICTALHLAALRGVDIRILLPEKSDLRFVDYAAWTYIEQLLPKGIHFYLYHRGQLHQKVSLIDDNLSVIGTANLDNRSLHINFEALVVIDNATFNQQVARMLTDDFNCSIRLDHSALLERSYPARLISRIMRLFAPLQ